MAANNNKGTTYNLATSEIVDGNKVYGIGPTANDHGPLLLENGLPELIDPAIHQVRGTQDREGYPTGAQIRFGLVLEAKQIHRTIWSRTVRRDEDEVAYSSSFGGINQLMISRLINSARAIRALSFAGMSGGDHLCDSLACFAQRGWITQITSDHISTERLEVLQFVRSA